jgi:hypothetical protein
VTVTDNGRVDAELIAKGRELATGGRMPSKRQLREHLRKDWPTVNAVLGALAAERAATLVEAPEIRPAVPR